MLVTACVLETDIKRSVKKYILKKLIVEVLVDEDSLPSEVLEEYKEEFCETAADPTPNQIELNS